MIVRDLRGELRALVPDDHVHDPVLGRIGDRDHTDEPERRGVDQPLGLAIAALLGREQLVVELVGLHGLPDQPVACEHLLLLCVVVGAADIRAADDVLALAEKIREARLDLDRRVRFVDLRLSLRVDDGRSDSERHDGEHRPEVLAKAVEITGEVEIEQMFVRRRSGCLGGWFHKGLEGFRRQRRPRRSSAGRFF